MRAYPFFKAGLLLFFIMSTCTMVAMASADNGGYIVTPYTGEYEEWEIVDDSGADGTITFWELPLWIQISFISGMLVPCIAVFKYFPLLLGRVTSRKECPKQQVICSYISENPGCIESEISRDLGMKRGTLRYYLGRLGSKRLIFIIRKGKVKGIFHIGCSGSAEQNKLCLHLKSSDTRRSVLDRIISEPGITGQELSSWLGLDKSTIHWHITKLREDDLVHSEKNGRSRKHYPRSDQRVNPDLKSPLFSN
jgi:predicted transcriptional regulator